MKAKRKDIILKYIVEDFIQTAEPVGSKNLLAKHRLDLASATIRNVMMELEKDGLIEKTHTSSGRVPTTAGYQYYLEKLADESPSQKANPEGDEFDREFAMALSSRTASVENTISEACKILSQVTQLATVVLGQDGSKERLVSVTVTPISDRAATVILVTDQGHVESKTFSVPKGSSLQAITYGMKLLDERLKGTPLGGLESKVKTIEPILKSQVGRDFQIVLQAFAEACLSFSKKKVEAYGGTKLMELPEFSEDTSFRRAVSALLGGGTPPPGEGSVETRIKHDVQVVMNPEHDVSVVKKFISLPGIPDAEIDIVGPIRMDYRRVLAALDAMSSRIMHLLGFDEALELEDASPDDDDEGGELIEIEEGEPHDERGGT